MIHELKILPEYFKEIIEGKKKFELRKYDRDFQVGDILILKEHNGIDYTGATCVCDITYILKGGKFGLDKEYCILSIDAKIIGSIDISSKKDTTIKMSELGRFLRALRIKKGELLIDMSQKAKMTPAELSSIELGRTKKIPTEFYRIICKEYDLNTAESLKLSKLIKDHEDE